MHEGLRGGTVAGRMPAQARPRRGHEALRRRALTVPAALLALVACTLALPLLVAGALAVDAVRRLASRRPWVTIRLVLAGWAYLLAEVLGLAALAAIPLTAGLPGPARDRRVLERTYAVQRLWARFLLRVVSAAFGLRWSVEGDETVAPGPVLVLMRHASILDTLLPSVLVGGSRGIRLRYVLKRELLVDPCLDVAGNRLPNCFVDRAGARSSEEIARVRALAGGLGREDGVLIYPEGTRFSQARRDRILARLEREDPLRARRARGLRNVLPPRPGGTLALLEAAPAADVVVCAHHGLDGLASVGDIWRGRLVGRRIEVSFRRITRDRIPDAGPARMEWLDRTWRDVDQWVGARVSARA